MLNTFKNTKSFQFTKNGVNLGWSDPIYKNLKIFLRLSEVPPKFLISQRLENS